MGPLLLIDAQVWASGDYLSAASVRLLGGLPLHSGGPAQGKRLIIANATGCSSIWGGTAGWVPYTKDKETGRGVAWGNSLFEDNAEFGLGQFLAVRQRRLQLKDRVKASHVYPGRGRCMRCVPPDGCSVGAL